MSICSIYSISWLKLVICSHSQYVWDTSYTTLNVSDLVSMSGTGHKNLHLTSSLGNSQNNTCKYDMSLKRDRNKE